MSFKLTLANFFSIVLLVTAISMTTHHQVTSEEILDSWIDINCPLDNFNCNWDCVNKHGATANGYCNGNICCCKYFLHS